MTGLHSQVLALTAVLYVVDTVKGNLYHAIALIAVRKVSDFIHTIKTPPLYLIC